MSALYYPPTEKVLDLVADLMTHWMEFQPDLVALAQPMEQVMDLSALLVDFSALFLGPFKLLAPPYGSIYLEGKREVMGLSTQDVQQRYARTGLVLAESSKDAPDHIAFELEFMYYLIYRHCEALEQADESAARKWQAEQTAFLRRHLGAWVDSFASQVQEQATTEFYTSAAVVTASFIGRDGRDLGVEAAGDPAFAANGSNRL